jgi:hypothetical protein
MSANLAEAPESKPAPPAKETSLDKKRRYNERINLLAAEARPAEVTEIGKRKLFEEWERACITIEKAKQMLADAIEYKQKCAEDIVKKLGRTHYRYKEVLYSPTAKTTREGKVTVFLRPLGKHAIDV